MPRKSSIFHITEQDILIARNYARKSGEDYYHDVDDWYSRLVQGNSFPILRIDSLEDTFQDALQEPFVDEEHDEVPVLKRTDIYATNDETVNEKNDKYLLLLKAISGDFCRRLERADFEDGYHNDIIDEVEGYMKENKFATMMWLYDLYAENMRNHLIVSGLLRIVGSVINKSEINHFIALIKCGLNDEHVACQEAALMLIEELRTKECADAIRTTKFRSPMIQRYADDVLQSIDEEMRICC